MNAEDILNQVRIAKPCPANWEEMKGDERVRFCEHCQKHVFNLSAMNANDAVTLVRAKEGKLCARMYLRRDGTLLTGDCPVGVARYRRRVAWAVGWSVGLTAAVFGIPITRLFAVSQVEDRIDQVLAVFGFQRQSVTLGEAANF